MSSYEAEWLKSDPEVAEVVRRSDFYAMAMRPEMLFGQIDVNPPRIIIPIEAMDFAGNSISDSVEIDLRTLCTEFPGVEPDDLLIEGGQKFIRIWAGSEQDVDAGRGELITWFTTEKLLFDRSRELPGIAGISHLATLTEYRLLYVGIARKTDTYERLLEKAHLKRQLILSTEWPHRAGARVSDELILFPLRVEPYVFRTLGPGDSLTSFSPAEWEDYRRKVTRDAEKGFIHLLKPNYNDEGYASYPVSTDGLYGEGYSGYSYALAENVKFRTAKGVLKGTRSPVTGMYTDEASLIVVSGNEVALIP